MEDVIDGLLQEGDLRYRVVSRESGTGLDLMHDCDDWVVQTEKEEYGGRGRTYWSGCSFGLDGDHGAQMSNAPTTAVDSGRHDGGCDRLFVNALYRTSGCCGTAADVLDGWWKEQRQVFSCAVAYACARAGAGYNTCMADRGQPRAKSSTTTKEHPIWNVHSVLLSTVQRGLTVCLFLATIYSDTRFFAKVMISNDVIQLRTK